MARAAQLTESERQEVIDLLGQALPYAEIARRTRRSTSTVSRIAQTIGHVAGQTNVLRAHEARSAYSAERRAVAASQMQERVEELLQGFFDERPHVVPGKDGPEVVLSAPAARDIADLARAISTLQGSVLAVDKHDNRQDEATSAVEAWLKAMKGE